MKAIATLILSLSFAGAAPLRAQHMGPVEVAQLPVIEPTVSLHYGKGGLQIGELRLPVGQGPFPLAVVVHGGCFTKGFATLSYMRPLASDLARRGVATWNIEYRQVGDLGGGWPGTFEDWAAAADHVRQLAKRYPLDLSRVIVVGHSAGASAALWLASRPLLPRSAALRGREALSFIAAIAIDGPADLGGWIGMDAKVCNMPVIVPLFGGTPSEVPERYALGDPALMPKPRAATVLIASLILSPQDAERFAASDAHTRIVELQDAGHFDMLAPGNPNYATLVAAIMSTLHDTHASRLPLGYSVLSGPQVVRSSEAVSNR